MKMLGLVFCLLFAVAFGKIDSNYLRSRNGAGGRHEVGTSRENNYQGDASRNGTIKPLAYQYIDYDYTGVDVHAYQLQKEQARNWLLSLRREDFGWGDDTQRAIIALQLSNDRIVDGNTQDEMLMTKQLHIKISLHLARNHTKAMRLSDLSLYINALQASCGDPRNFYGFDLVSTLRRRVDVSHLTGHTVSPLAYLTLCVNNATASNDPLKLKDIFSNGLLDDKIGIQALALLASVCIAKLPGREDRHLNEWIKLLLSKTSAGFPRNVYEVALIVQALNEARVDSKLWNRKEALTFLMDQQKESGSFGDILATYYVLPILSNKSLLSLSKHCSKNDSNGLTPIEILMHSKKSIDVNYALYHGEPVELSQTLMLSVSTTTNFFDIMRLAQEKNPNYRFSLDESKDVPSVYSIGGIPNDAERGMYWMLYLRNSSNSSTEYNNLVPYKGSLKNLLPKFGQEFVFWMKAF